MLTTGVLLLSTALPILRNITQRERFRNYHMTISSSLFECSETSLLPIDTPHATQGAKLRPACHAPEAFNTSQPVPWELTWHLDFSLIQTTLLIAAFPCLDIQAYPSNRREQKPLLLLLIPARLLHRVGGASLGHISYSRNRHQLGCPKMATRLTMLLS